MDIRPIDAFALAEKISAYTGAMTALSCMPTLTLNTLRDAIYQDAVAHGLWEQTDKDYKALLNHPYRKHIAEGQMWLDGASLVAQEAKELFTVAEDGFHLDVPLEAYREHFEEELADVVIQAFSTAGKLGIDIDAAIRRKMEINKNRPWKHGKEEKK